MDFLERESNVQCDISQMETKKLPDPSGGTVFSSATPCNSPNSSHDDTVDGQITIRPTAAFFKRWNSMPTGIGNFTNNHSLRCQESSSSSNGDSDDEADSLDISTGSVPNLPNIERKSSVCTFAKRSDSATKNSNLIRHRSSSNALYLKSMPLRLLDKGIEKLKREANITSCIQTDYAGEKMSITGAAIMCSMDEFGIVDVGQDLGMGNFEQRKRALSLTEPVHVMTNLLPASCSPSPNSKVEKQCYSPSMQQIVRNVAMASPTRPQCVRSVSPIALRTGTGLKRKCDTVMDGCVGTAKRANRGVANSFLAFSLENMHTSSRDSSDSPAETSIDMESSSSTNSIEYADTSSTDQAIFQQPQQPVTAAVTSETTNLSIGHNEMTDYLVIPSFHPR